MKKILILIIILMTITAIGCKSNPTNNTEKNRTENNDYQALDSTSSTISLTCTKDDTGQILLEWSPYICKDSSDEIVLSYNLYNIIENDTILIDVVGSSTHMYGYYQDDYIKGYLMVAAVINEKKQIFSNTIKLS